MVKGGYTRDCFYFVWRNILLDPLFASPTYRDMTTAPRDIADGSTVGSNVTGGSNITNDRDNYFNCCLKYDERL